jgi:hypothetical protein
MLSQAVTTVWRTELGTTLLDGFNSTTDGSAYFHYLCSYQSAMNRRRQTKFLCRMAPHHAGGSLLGGFFELKEIPRTRQTPAESRRQPGLAAPQSGIAATKAPSPEGETT